MDVSKDKVVARIAELREELKRFVDIANRQVAGYEASIAELERLLAPPSEESKGEQEVEAESG